VISRRPDGASLARTKPASSSRFGVSSPLFEARRHLSRALGTMKHTPARRLARYQDCYNHGLEISPARSHTSALSARASTMNNLVVMDSRLISDSTSSQVVVAVTVRHGNKYRRDDLTPAPGLHAYLRDLRDRSQYFCLGHMTSPP